MNAERTEEVRLKAERIANTERRVLRMVRDGLTDRAIGRAIQKPAEVIRAIRVKAGLPATPRNSEAP